VRQTILDETGIFSLDASRTRVRRKIPNEKTKKAEEKAEEKPRKDQSREKESRLVFQVNNAEAAKKRENKLR
jgi:hypothetical protein